MSGLTVKVLERFYGSDKSKTPTINYLSVMPAVPSLHGAHVLLTGNEVKLTPPASLPAAKHWLQVLSPIYSIAFLSLVLARRLSSACLAIGPTNSPLSIPLDNANQIFSQSTSTMRSCHHHHHTFTTSVPNHQSLRYHPKHLRAHPHRASCLASSSLTSSSYRSLCTVTHINPSFAFPRSSSIVTTLKPTEHRQHQSHLCIQFLSTTGTCREAALNNNSNLCTCPMASRSSWFRPLKAGDVLRADNLVSCAVIP